MSTFSILRYRNLTARCVLAVIAPLAFDGCLSIDVDRTRLKSPDAAALCSLEARLYETGKDAKRDVKSTREVTWKLFHLDASPVVPAREGTGTTWSVTGLEAGKYRIAATWGPKPGVADDTPAGSGDDAFSLAPGDTARADVIIKKFPTAATVGIVAGIVGVIVAIVVVVTSINKGVEAMGGKSVSTRDEVPATGGSPRYPTR